MQVRHIVGLMLLLTTAVPLQMYLMKYNQDFRDLVMEIVKHLPGEDQLQLSIDYVAGFLNTASLSKPPLKHDSQEDQEIAEDLIHNFRPPHLEFRIGNVILTRAMTAGIIVGWNIDITDLTKEPEYLILEENHEELIKLDQNEIVVLLQNIKINHKKIEQYFESFDGNDYIPNKSLQKMYPKD